MIQISTLRRLADQQRFATLLERSQALTEVQRRACLPLLALACINTRQPDKARALLVQAWQHQPEYDVATLTDLAAALTAQGQFSTALEQLEIALAQQPDYPPALTRRGYCLWQQGETVMARDVLERSYELAPTRLATLTSLLGLSLVLLDFESAQRWLSETEHLLQQQRDILPPEMLQQQMRGLEHQQLSLWVQTEQFEKAESWIRSQSVSSVLSDQQLDAICHYGRQLAAADRYEQASEMVAGYLALSPDQPALCMLQAELAERQGYYRQAMQILRTALRNHPDNIDLWGLLSATALQDADLIIARQAAEKALALAEALPSEDPKQASSLASARTALAYAESMAQQFEKAEAAYLAVLAEMPDFLPALSGLGQQKLQQGKIDEAISLFEQVKQIDPLKGQVGLITARQFPTDIETLEALERAADNPALDGRLRTSLLFQLASSWEKHQDCDRAFTLVDQANRRNRTMLRYDASAHRQRCARIRMAFDRALYQHRSGFGVASTLPVFIVGMPRSGTTLIEQILAGHSEICGAGELGLIPECIGGIERWERYIGSGRGYPDCMDDLTRDETRRLAEHLLDRLQEFSPGARHVIDKLPHNFENIGLIRFLFPNARIISVRRDPRDIALSNYFTDFQARHGGMGYAYDLKTIGTHLADHNLLMHHWHQIFPGQILELQYEDVIEDLEGNARKMLAYIGVEWQPQVLNFDELERPVSTASVWQVRQPIYKTSRGRWQRYQRHLAPLIEGTNAPIRPDPITDMITLPEPGFFTEGVALYRAGDLDGAEMSFKKMLHHNPSHAGCQYMVGLIYLHKHHWQAGIALMEQALETAPWQDDWRNNLARAYLLTGRPDAAQALNPAVGREDFSGFPEQGPLPDGSRLLKGEV